MSGRPRKWLAGVLQPKVDVLTTVPTSSTATAAAATPATATPDTMAASVQTSVPKRWKRDALQSATTFGANPVPKNTAASAMRRLHQQALQLLSDVVDSSNVAAKLAEHQGILWQLDQWHQVIEAVPGTSNQVTEQSTEKELCMQHSPPQTAPSFEKEPSIRYRCTKKQAPPLQQLKAKKASSGAGLSEPAAKPTPVCDDIPVDHPVVKPARCEHAAKPTPVCDDTPVDHPLEKRRPFRIWRGARSGDLDPEIRAEIRWLCRARLAETGAAALLFAGAEGGAKRPRLAKKAGIGATLPLFYGETQASWESAAGA